MTDKAVSFAEKELKQRKLASPSNIPGILSLIRAVISMSGEHCEIVQFVANRSVYEDSIYGTGSWIKGEKKAVPVKVANEMVKQIGVYSLADGNTDAFKPVKIPQLDKGAEERRTNFIHQLQAMNDPQQLRTVARDNFQGWEPDGRIKDPVRVREAVMAHATAYGDFS